MDFKEARQALSNPKNVRFDDLLRIAICFFGAPRSKGTSHHIFKTPWQGLPYINLQRDGKNAKAYQVRQFLQALDKLEVMQKGQVP